LTDNIVDINNALDRKATEQDRRALFTLYADLKATASKLWLVYKMLGCGEASTFYGAPGCGKGVIIEDLCLHIAAGRDWHGRRVMRGAVVYVALERKKLVERRAIAFRTKHGLLDLPFAIVGGVHDFRDPATARTIADICRWVEEATAETVVLIVIDTLSRALAGGDENSPKDMGAIVNSTAHLQDKTKAHVLWVHHMPHEGERMRGHGALLGAMDTTLHVVKTAGERTATVVKANDSEEGERVSFQLESVVVGEDGTTAPVVVPVLEPKAPTAPEAKLNDNQEAMLRLLRDAGARGLSTDDWNARARDTGIGLRRKATLHNLKEQLRDRGLVRKYNDIWHAER
jgi:AAA domain-containing protein